GFDVQVPISAEGGFSLACLDDGDVGVCLGAFDATRRGDGIVAVTREEDSAAAAVLENHASRVSQRYERSVHLAPWGAKAVGAMPMGRRMRPSKTGSKDSCCTVGGSLKRQATAPSAAPLN